MKKYFLFLTIIALCPVTMQAMQDQSQEGRSLVANRSERIAQLQTELARLQDLEAATPHSPVRRRSPIAQVEQQPAPIAQIMQDNPNQVNQQNRQGCSFGRGLAIGVVVVGGTALASGLGYLIYECCKNNPCDDQSYLDAHHESSKECHDNAGRM